MKSFVKFFTLLLVGLLALSGCSALRSILAGGSAAGGAPAGAKTEEVESAPGAPLFTFYDSWASW